MRYFGFHHIFHKTLGYQDFSLVNNNLDLTADMTFGLEKVILISIMSLYFVGNYTNDYNYHLIQGALPLTSIRHTPINRIPFYIGLKSLNVPFSS